MIYEDTCHELGLSPEIEHILDEAGGLISVLARAYTGKDADLAQDIEEELKSVKTEERKKELLDDVDDFIKEAEANHFLAKGVEHMPADLEPGKVAWPGSDLFSKRMAWFKKNTHDNAGQVKKAITINLSGGLVGQLISAALTRANAQDGTTKKYIAALKAARAKVAAYKVPKE